MAEDNPSWARATPVEIKHILLTALAARDLPRRRRRAVAADLAERIELLAAAAHPFDANRKLVAHLHNEGHALFSFLRHYGTDATNWRAEPAIRPAVVNRKVWGGNRTRRGADTQGRIHERAAHRRPTGHRRRRLAGSVRPGARSRRRPAVHSPIEVRRRPVIHR